MRCVIVPHPSSQFAFNADFLSPLRYRHNLAMRILLAEDEHALAEWLSKALAQSGYKVDWLDDGRMVERAVAAQALIFRKQL